MCRLAAKWLKWACCLVKNLDSGKQQMLYITRYFAYFSYFFHIIEEKRNVEK